jgi:hypothetical protein
LDRDRQSRPGVRVALWRSTKRLGVPWRGRVRTGSTVPANPAHVGQALLQCCESAIPATHLAIYCAPFCASAGFSIQTTSAKTPRMDSESLIVLSGTFVCFGSVFRDLLGFCQQEPTFGQNKPRPSVLAIVAAVCVANAFSCFNATVIAFGHCGIMILKAYYSFRGWLVRSEATGGPLTERQPL